MASKRYDYLKRTDKGWLAKPSACYLGPNARTIIDQEKLERLQAQITGVGVKEPLLVRRTPDEFGHHLQIWDGQRRFLAATNLIDKGEPIEWIPVRIEQGSDADMMIAAAQTVTGKEPLDPVDEAGMVAMLLGYGLEADEIAKRLGMSVPWVNRRRSLQSLEPKARTALRTGLITIGRAEELAKLPRKQQMAKLPSKPTKKGTKPKPQGKEHKRPGKKQIRLLGTRLAPVIVAGQLPVADLVESILEWVCGDLSTEELQQTLGLKEQTEAEPEPVTITDEELVKAEMDRRIECQKEGIHPGPLTEEFLKAQTRQQLADLKEQYNPNLAKVQQALGVELAPPTRPVTP